MENLNEPNEENVMTDRQLDKVINTLLDIDNMDDRPLYFKIKGKIAERKAAARRRRMRWIGGGGAAAAVVVLAMIILISTGREGLVDAGGETGVRLIVSDGRSYNLTGDAPSGDIISDGTVVMKAEESTLFVETSGVQPETAEVAYNTLEVPKGMQYDMVLSDGTKVWLNSDTRFTFPAVFTGEERRVSVEGEAYFEVARIEGRPFVVDMESQSVTVLGTSFNVNAYDYNPSVLTTLFSGIVKVGNSVAETVLAPGQQAALDKDTGDISVREVNTGDALAWRINIINLEKRTLQDITSYMSKIYNVEFRFVDDSARQIRFRGNVTRSEDIFPVLDRIGEVGGVRFSDNGSEIEIRMR